MANLPASLVAHLRADTTLCSLLAATNGSTRINLEWDTILSPEAPQIYLGTLSGGGTIGSAFSVRRIVIWVEAATAALCESVHARLWTILHDTTGYTLGASPNTTRCELSRRIDYTGPGRATPNGTWDADAAYEFILTETF